LGERDEDENKARMDGLGMRVGSIEYDYADIDGYDG